MATDNTRLSLARLRRENETLLLDNDRVSLTDYAAFKYGIGSHALDYGAALAELVKERVGDGNLLVTSSGYKFAPPAANSLVAPFARAHGAATPFKVHRESVSNGDYAKMGLRERKKAMAHDALSVDIDLTGQVVVSLDDVRVTGVHEQVIEQCLRDAGAEQIIHAYIIDAWAVRHDPSTESALNSSSVQSTSELLTVTTDPSFIPNARFAKRVIGMDAREQDEFVSRLPEQLQAWLIEAISGDRLDMVDSYSLGAQRLLTKVGAR